MFMHTWTRTLFYLFDFKSNWLSITTSNVLTQLDSSWSHILKTNAKTVYEWVHSWVWNETQQTFPPSPRGRISDSPWLLTCSLRSLPSGKIFYSIWTNLLSSTSDPFLSPCIFTSFNNFKYGTFYLTTLFSNMELKFRFSLKWMTHQLSQCTT